MFRFSVICLIIVSLVLVEIDGKRNERRKNVVVRRTRTKVRVVTSRPAITRDEAPTSQFTNRHRRTLDQPSPPEENTITKDTRPCILHSIRYGCMCRYGDIGCNPLDDSNFIFSSRDLDYVI